MVIDDLRVSTVARRPDELGFAVGKLSPDPFTAVLDSFEADFEPDGKTATRPALILSGPGGVPSKGCAFVPGRFGKALSLVRPAEDAK